jgi:hypothetical protein
MIKHCFNTYAGGTTEATNHSESLQTSVFVFSNQMVESIKFGFEIICPACYLLRFMACHRNDTTNAFCNA